MNKKFILPLFNIKKPLKSKFTEKHMICFLLFLSGFSFYLIFRNLPTNTNTIERNSIIANVFVPLYNDSHRLIHHNEKDHEIFHNRQIPSDFESKSSSIDKNKPIIQKDSKIESALKNNNNGALKEEVKKLDIVAFRQETIKNVRK